MAYKLRAFLRHTDLALLEEYFQFRNIPLNQKFNEKDYPETLEDYINNLNVLEQEQVNLDFESVTQLANESGILKLIDLSTKSTNLRDAFESLEGYYDKSLYALIKDETGFQNASVFNYVEDLRSKVERTGLKSISISEAKSRSKDLEEQISAYLQVTDGRGKYCHIDPYCYEDRICFIAYPEDYAKTDFRYVGNALKRTSIKPAMEIIYIYYPKEGKLELNCNFRGKRKSKLLNIFNEFVLKDRTDIGEMQKVYDFNKILEDDFIMPTEVEDQVEYAFLKQLRLSYRYETGKKITLEVDPEEGNGTEDMKELLRIHNIKSKAVNVTQATFKIKFQGKGNKGSVTMRISFPDKCNLSDSETHLKAKKYLRIWGLENGVGN